jgi:hypothetical protein
MAIYDVQPRPRTLGFASLVLGILGLVFCWWVPVGMVLGLAGLVTGLIGWVRHPRRGAAIGLLTFGVVLSAVALGLDVFIAARGTELIPFIPMR